MANAPNQTRRVTPAAIALVAAALLAVAAIIVSVVRSGESASANGASNATAQNMQAGLDPNAMIAGLRERLAANPDDHETWYLLAQVLRQSGQMAEAERAFRRAMELQPNNAVYTAYVAESLLLQGGDERRGQARQLFQRAATLDGREPMVRFYLATMRDQDGQHAEAVNDLIALLRDAPPGAPWEAQVRTAVEAIARTNNIDIANRLPAPRPSTAGAAIPGPTREQMEAARGIPPGEQDQMVKGMVDRLAARLQQNPRDAEGWIRLMRSRMVLNDPTAARQALQSGLAAFEGDAATQQRLRQSAGELGIPAG